jgi:hypothetical protein
MAIRFRGLDAPIEVQYWKGGSAPVPDPNVQSAADKATNRYNISGPTGTQQWQQGPQTIQGYDQSGKPIYGSTDTQVTTLSPTEQRQYDTSNQIAESMLSGAQGKIGGDNGLANTTFSYDQAIPQAAADSYRHQIALLQPDFQNADKAFDQKMANIGLPIGSDAYNEGLRQHELDQNNAMVSAAAGAEQQGAQMSLSQRQQQYNELAAALGGQQVTPVNSFAGQGGANVDVAGAYGQANQARLANYNAGQAEAASNTQAGAGLAGTAVLAAVVF